MGGPEAPHNIAPPRGRCGVGVWGHGRWGAVWIGGVGGGVGGGRIHESAAAAKDAGRSAEGRGHWSAGRHAQGARDGLATPTGPSTLTYLHQHPATHPPGSPAPGLPIETNFQFQSKQIYNSLLLPTTHPLTWWRANPPPGQDPQRFRAGTHPQPLPATACPGSGPGTPLG